MIAQNKINVQAGLENKTVIVTVRLFDTREWV